VMTIFEMVISKVRSVNGGLVISPANGRIKSVAETTGTPAYYVIGIEGDMQFVVDDYVRCQVFSNGHAKFYCVRVSSISGNSILVLKSEFTNGAVPAIGDDLVQMGNATNKARQGIIYLTASEDGKPRISVMDGVNSTSLVGKSKVILGCLDGITDTDFPADFQPSGYGLYAMNVFLKGIFVLRNGKSVESEIEVAQNAAATAQAKADMITRLFQEFTVAGGLFESKITEVKEYADGKVNALQVGGRNLVINSAKRIDSNSYHIGNYVLSRDMLDGEELTITVWGELAEGQTVYVGRAPSSAMLVNLARGLDGTYSGKFLFNILPAYPNDVRNVIQLYNYKQTGNLSGRIDKIKVEIGNKATDWTEAPEDVTADAQAKANAAQAAAEAVAIAKAALAKTEASAYADGIVTEEEKRAIADAQAKLAEAKLDAQNKADAAKQAAISDAANKYPTKSEVTSSINQKADEINLSVTEKIEGVQVGGRNYYKKNTPYDPQATQAKFERLVSINGFQLTGAQDVNKSVIRLLQILTSNGYWTVSFEFCGTQNTPVGFYMDVCDTGRKYFQNPSTTNEYVRVEHTVNITNYSSSVYHFIDFDMITWTYITIRNFKVEKGTKATDWTPAPEDVQSQITENKANIQVLSDQIALKVSNDTFNALGQRVSAAESTLSVQATQIASKVSQSDFNDLGVRVGSAESEIKQQAKQISLMVKKDDLTITGIDIVNRKITLTADSTVFRNNAGQQIAIFENDRIKTDLIDARAIVTGSLLAEQIAATNITTGRLTVTDGAVIGGMVIENNVLKGGSMVLTEGAVVGGFTISKENLDYSLINNDLSAKIEITASNNRYLRIGGKSSTMMAMRLDSALDGYGNEGISIQSYGANNVCLSLIANAGSAYSIRSFGSHVFGQRNGEKWNAPGVLWCGHYSLSSYYPTLVRSWGDGLGVDVYGNRIVPNISRARAGNYTIIHGLGHTDYYVHAIGNAQIRDDWNWWNTTVGFLGHSANSFSLQFKDDGGGEKDPAEFQVMIFGRNKW
ncbi:MAG: hypothetical protein RR924_14500, partial [Bacteroides sp.]